jgi:hypothetical protein
MHPVWAIILIAIPGFAFFGQLISCVFPRIAERAGLTAGETEVDPAYYADLRGEAFWDALILWTLPVAGLVGLLKNDLWTPLCLIGGGMYIYFSGRGIFARISYLKRSIRIGGRSETYVAIIFLFVWGLTGVLAIILAVGR